ncbi:MAG: hypothetical protein GF347_01840 [Candidatus Moranbacteria bacterium]|nr:hypothetical protein [Candidatus Moranbacteria bacterium]
MPITTTLAASSGGYGEGKDIAGTGTGLEQDVKFSSVLQTILYVGALLLGSLGVLGFLISGIIYVTAAGNEDRMETAKRAMMYSIVGVVVGSLGFALINLIEAVSKGEETF